MLSGELSGTLAGLVKSDATLDFTVLNNNKYNVRISTYAYKSKSCVQLAC